MDDKVCAVGRLRKLPIGMGYQKKKFSTKFRMKPRLHRKCYRIEPRRDTYNEPAWRGKKGSGGRGSVEERIVAHAKGSERKEAGARLGPKSDDEGASDLYTDR